ncbi:hypothetical protein CQA01_09130 [Cyclobacterium qasimii]|uniref:Uncharacterized protein n=1 Tax=Cyclobacterium qasimii TaxID=1350429 RepID=A0A512C840_9BACT|nr:hypothetical protein CQA01_09130 [Cyclobacterium qasimii]
MGGFVMTKTFSKFGELFKKLNTPNLFQIFVIKKEFYFINYKRNGNQGVSFANIRYYNITKNNRKEFLKIGGLTALATMTV